MRSFSSGCIAFRVQKAPTDLSESRSDRGGSGDWDCSLCRPSRMSRRRDIRKFCRSGDEERPGEEERSRDPSPVQRSRRE